MANCYKAVKGRRIRVTRVDACGRPVYGEDSQATSSGVITVEWTANTIESDEINQSNFAGERCVYEPAVPELTGYTLNLTFCEVDPELFALVTGQRVYYDSEGNAIGIAVSTDVSMEDSGFALEVWAGAPVGDACADEGAQGSYGYFLAPFLKGGIMGDYTIENGAVTFTIQGATTRDGNGWGAGPYNVMLDAGVPAPLITPLEPNDHQLMIWVTVAPPAAVCGTRPLLDPTSTPITAVVATADADDATNMTAEFAFTGAVADEPVWIDFGDGTWDYVEDGTAGANHQYATAGTYTVKASSNNTWVETTVTVPFP